MNTDFHINFATIEEEDQLDYLLGTLRSRYCELSLSSWKSQLEKLLYAATSDTYSAKEKTNADFGQFIAQLKELVEAAWTCEQQRKRSDYKHEYLLIPWKNNPLGLSLNKFNEQDLHLTSYLRMHDGKITILSQEEAGNFFLVFDRFFQELDVVSWRKLLDLWHRFAESHSSIVSGGYDYEPQETHRQLLRLLEACYLADRFGFCPTYYPPNSHLFHRDNMMLELYSETCDGYNPYLQLTWIFTAYSLPELMGGFLHWMDCAKNKEKIYTREEPATLILLCSDVIKLLEIGWLILYTMEMPEHWLDPKTFDDNVGHSLVNTKEESLSFLCETEQLNPGKALRKFYKNNRWYHYQRMNLNDALYYALHTKAEYHDVKIFAELEQKIGKLMEILYLVNRQFHIGLQEKVEGNN